MTTWDGDLQIEPTALPAVVVVSRRRRSDARGHLERLFCDALLDEAFPSPVRQINQTVTRSKGTVRGLHYQRSPAMERKLVSCLGGEVLDVVVDLRHGSPTFLHWHGEVLSETNGRAMVVPEGCAHGFQTLADGCRLLYLHSAAYAAEHECGLRPTDPLLNIDWPLPITDMSDRDRAHPLLDSRFAGLLSN